MSEKTRIKKVIENGKIRYTHVPITAEDIIIERDEEIKNLKALVDSLREKITQLEQEQQRTALLDKEAGPVSSYDMYI
jgi:gamma-glutamyl phosphate reductase